MKNALVIAVFAVLLTLMHSGCDLGSAGVGAAGGAVAAGGGYEYAANKEMNRIEQEYKDGKMDQSEYEIRKDQIQRMSLLK